ALRLRDRGRRGRLGDLARYEVVAEIPRRDVDDVAALAERLRILQENCLGHERGSRPYRTRCDCKNRAIQGGGERIRLCLSAPEDAGVRRFAAITGRRRRGGDRAPERA